ncbi:hypothetical protein A2761_00020 [Candidatus Kaiserbacteria bacterium RIFCSPHIGHO2_01_FULL_51_33]|uniref:Band 7 domain-containing protein n=1 Tax=Candidatus Kaiserbacteria bacterium RIFCSPLOWO2_01_FULL_51_21 TaxID=1798508 RepID=A0A1F6ECF4_9BACT|nr:MAG: hypothetical protein A2761_00020 [Candidatus Kaiserbacteria bacterium RIFCSPHIGHO2_01_FULL_51_33]OGG71363.1 MAG: hypothetical protein A3A35_03050 [Candidatus Kaiserbacteria bacterium RIFCSPLOWO2_01_FULL_51_21]
MNTMPEDIVTALILVVLAMPLIIAIVLLLANLGAYFLKIAQGTTIFINAGDSLRAILPNIGGFKISDVEDPEGRRWLVPELDEKKRMEAFFHNSLPKTVWFQKILWKTLGIRFISVFWPHTNIHTFDIHSRKRLREGADVEPGAPLRSRIKDSTGSTVVDSLLFLVPRPVYLEGMQLAGDNSQVNLLFLPIYRQIIPALPVYYLKGDFFTQLDAAIEAAMVDFFATHQVAVDKETKQFAADFYDPPQDEKEKRKYMKRFEPSFLTYSHWLKLTRSGEKSPIEQHLRSLNASRGYYDQLGGDAKWRELKDYLDQLTHGKFSSPIPTGQAAKVMPSGIIPRFGFALVSLRLVDWEQHKDTVKLAQALLAKEIELHTAEGERQKAYGVRDAINARGTGEAGRYTKLVTALIDNGVHPNVAAEVVRTQLRTENIGGKESKVVTYVEGGGDSSVMVPATSPKTPGEAS